MFNLYSKNAGLLSKLLLFLIAGNVVLSLQASESHKNEVQPTENLSIYNHSGKLEPMSEHPIFPDFQLFTEENQPITQEAFRGKTTVLYFYPKDMTPGCTTEACSLRDDFKFFTDRGIQIYGVSPDSSESHTQFINKHALPFSLIADTEHQLAEHLGVWVEKSMYGRKYWGVERSTFIIGPDLEILASFRRVNPNKHSAQLQEYFAEHPLKKK